MLDHLCPSPLTYRTYAQIKAISVIIFTIKTERKTSIFSHTTKWSFAIVKISRNGPTQHLEIQQIH